MKRLASCHCQFLCLVYRTLAAAGGRGRFRRHNFYDQVEDAVLAKDCYPGILNLDRLKESAVQAGADYCILGPVPFIKMQFQDLAALRVVP